MTAPRRSGHVLVVDDDAAIRTVVAEALRRAGHEATAVACLHDLDAAIARRVPDVLLTDVVLPDGDGLERAAELALSYPELPVIVFSARNTLATAVRATEAGAFDYLPKPFDLDALARSVSAALVRCRGASEPQVAQTDENLPLIGRSPAMQEVYRTIARVVATDLTVLVSGESGTGKELVARAIHDLGARAAAPFVALNMAAIPRELIEAELFGHERGAFTGAGQRMAGRFEQAAGGTLFLDEIGDMPTDAQTRLLRVLQSGEFTSVGGARPLRADVRVVAATNRDLAAQVTSGQFREDLFYRLNVVPIAMPPLRDRTGDVAMLARHFLDRAAEQGLPRKTLDGDAVAALDAYGWPGNVRELENLMRRLSVLSRDDRLGGADVVAMLGRREVSTDPGVADDPDLTVSQAVRVRLDRLARSHPATLEDGTLYERIIGEVERPLIEAMLQRFNGNQLRAALALGINRNTLRKRLDTLGIDAAGRPVAGPTA